MESSTVRITVYFEKPFWVCVYERQTKNGLEVCRIVFGAEPKEYEVYDFLLRHWKNFHFSPTVTSGSVPEQKQNPKRMQREIHSQLISHGVGTKAQQALKLQREQNQQSAKQSRKERREQEKQFQFELHRQKRKEKHRGR